MKLIINSLHGVVYEGDIDKLMIDTMGGVLTILPGHHPLASVTRPGIVKIFPCDSEQTPLKEFMTGGSISLSVDKGLMLVDTKKITISVGTATVSPDHNEEILESMKKKLEDDLKEIRTKGSLDDIEKALTHMQKIKADLQLIKIRQSV